jgi:hypothetical protein
MKRAAPQVSPPCGVGIEVVSKPGLTGIFDLFW